MPHTFFFAKDYCGTPRIRTVIACQKTVRQVPAAWIVSAKPNAGKAAEKEVAIFPVFFFLALGRGRGVAAFTKEPAQGMPQRLVLRRAARDSPDCQRTIAINLSIQGQAVCSLSRPIGNQ
jgi:hypothetical protein